MKKLLTLAALTLLSSTAFAAPTTLESGTAFTTSEISGYTTDGDDMTGMLITATFADGTSELATFTGNGYGAGSADANLFDLNYNGGSTFSGAWTLTSSNTTSELVNLLISGSSGDTVFDVIGYDTHTPGSASGGPGPISPKNASMSNGTTAQFTYMNEVFLGDTFHGDLYESLSIDLVGFSAGDYLKWTNDTDNSALAGDIVVQAPETGTMLLLGLGLVGLAMVRRK